MRDSMVDLLLRVEGLYDEAVDENADLQERIDYLEDELSACQETVEIQQDIINDLTEQLNER